MKVAWTDDAWDDYVSWLSKDKKVLKRINKLIQDIRRDPFTGIGKPEQLRFELSGLWSRRINSEHRIVYEVKDNEIIIYSVKSHYDE